MPLSLRERLRRLGITSPFTDDEINAPITGITSSSRFMPGRGSSGYSDIPEFHLGTKSSRGLNAGGSNYIPSRVTSAGALTTDFRNPQTRYIGELEKLKASTDKMRQKAEAISGGPVEDEPSVLNKVLDKLSRPNYAIAEAVKSIDDPSVINRDIGTRLAAGLEGLKEGFTGQEKTTFSDVVTQEEERTGREYHPVVKGAGSFALDVALDPTTYVGGSIVKKIGKEAIEEAGVKATRRALADPNLEQKATQIASRRLAELAKANKGKIPKGSRLTNIKTEVYSDLVKDIAIKAKEDAAEAGIGRFSVNVLGREMGNSKTVYNIGSKVAERAGSTAAGKWANDAFRTVSKYPGKINFIRRSAEGRSIAEFSDGMKAWRGITKDLSDEQATQISHAIEDGTELTGRLGEVQAEARKLLDDFWEIEEEIGLHVPKEVGEMVKRDNYLYHAYKNKGSKFYQAAKQYRRKLKAVGTEKPGFEKARTFDTLIDAQDAGLNPITDIREIVARRAAKHHRLLARHDFVTELGTEYGVKLADSKAAKALGLKKHGSRFLPEDTYFPEQIVDVLKGIDEVYSSDEASDALLRVLDFTTNKWKTLATIWNPGHHIRNMMGDVFLNFLDGVVNPMVYEDAFRLVMKDHNTTFAEQAAKQSDRVASSLTDEALLAARPQASQNLANLTRANRGQIPTGQSIDSLAKQAITEQNVPGIKVAGSKVDDVEVRRLFNKYGLKTGFFRTEFGIEGTSKGATERIRRLAEFREETARMAHFVDALKKEAKGIVKTKPGEKAYRLQLEEAAAQAAARVRKWNIDYGDFTQFETNKLKRAFPFYSWMRKNIPLQVEAIALRPGRVVALPKAQRAIEVMLGTENDSFGVEDVIPKWLLDESAIRLTDDEQPWMFDPGLPLQDINMFSGGPVGMIKNLVASSNPLVRVPFEVAQDKKTFSGAPITDHRSYAAEQIPMGRIANKIYESARGQRGWGQTGEDITRWATGLGVRRVTEPMQQSELRRQQQPLKAIIAEYNRRKEELGY